MAKDYKVGYGRPPKHTRFRKGQSGNPRGRPKGSRNLATEFAEALAAPVLVREGGRARWVSRRCAILLSLIAKAMQGDPRAQKLVFELDRQREPEKSPEVTDAMRRRAVDEIMRLTDALRAAGPRPE